MASGRLLSSGKLAMNPCPCGYHGDPARQCTCSASLVARYQQRISGPLLDRIDIHVEVPRVEYDKLSDSRLGEPSSAICERVERARERQRQRFAAPPPVAQPDSPSPEERRRPALTCNADMGPTEVRRHCATDDTGRALLKTAVQQLNLSARGYHRILKLSRTIADLAGSETIQVAHLAEAIQYRPRRS